MNWYRFQTTIDYICSISRCVGSHAICRCYFSGSFRIICHRDWHLWAVKLWQAGRNASLKLDSHAGQALSPFKWILDNQFLLLNKERDDNIAYHKCYILKYICIYVKKFESFLHTDFGIFSSQVILSLHLLVLDNSYRRNVYNI